MGSLMIEENVVASAGTVYYLTLEQIKRAIRSPATSLANATSSTSISTPSPLPAIWRCGLIVGVFGGVASKKLGEWKSKAGYHFPSVKLVIASQDLDPP